VLTGAMPVRDSQKRFFLNILQPFPDSFFEGRCILTPQAKSPLTTGLAFLPMTALITIVNLAAGWLTARFGPRLPLVLGQALAATGYFALAGVDAATPYATVVGPLLAAGVGSALAVPAMTAAVLAHADKQQVGIASGALNATRPIGGVIGVGVFGSLVAGKTISPTASMPSPCWPAWRWSSAASPPRSVCAPGSARAWTRPWTRPWKSAGREGKNDSASDPCRRLPTQSVKTTAGRWELKLPPPKTVSLSMAARIFRVDPASFPINCCGRTMETGATTRQPGRKELA
jgi:MFS family permease